MRRELQLVKAQLSVAKEKAGSKKPAFSVPKIVIPSYPFEVVAHYSETYIIQEQRRAITLSGCPIYVVYQTPKGIR